MKKLNSNKKYDVFVSHSSADKRKYVDNLVKELKAVGLKVFYDKECILWGDSISKKVDEALNNCTLAVVVISKHYFGRNWTEYELKQLLLRQNSEHHKIIMPILYRISKEEMNAHYPELADIVFKHSKSCSCKQMAMELKQEIMSRKLKD